MERGGGVGGEGGNSSDGSPAVVAAEDGALNKGGKAAGERKNRRMLSVKVRFQVTPFYSLLRYN
jgi:hypothetical protein